MPRAEPEHRFASQQFISSVLLGIRATNFADNLYLFNPFQNYFELRLSVVAHTEERREDVTLLSFISDRITLPLPPWNALDFASKKDPIPIL